MGGRRRQARSRVCCMVRLENGRGRVDHTSTPGAVECRQRKGKTTRGSVVLLGHICPQFLAIFFLFFFFFTVPEMLVSELVPVEELKVCAHDAVVGAPQLREDNLVDVPLTRLSLPSRVGQKTRQHNRPRWIFTVAKTF